MQNDRFENSDTYIQSLMEKSKSDKGFWLFILNRRMKHLQTRILKSEQNLTWDKKERNVLSEVSQLISDIYEPDVDRQTLFWSKFFEYFMNENTIDLKNNEHINTLVSHMYACIRLKLWTKDVSFDETLEII